VRTKYIAFFLVLFLISLSLFGCSSDPVRQDLYNYAYKELPKITALYSKIEREYESVSGENYTDDKTISNAIKNVIVPQSLSLIDAAKAIVLTTEEVKAVHEKLITVINTQNSALNILLSAHETQDYDKIALANEKLETAKKYMSDYIADVYALGKSHKVKLKKD